jgi:hypothetical protein
METPERYEIVKARAVEAFKANGRELTEKELEILDSFASDIGANFQRLIMSMARP